MESQQLEMLEVTKPTPQPVADQVIFLQQTKQDAIQLAIRVSGLTEKQVYMAMGIDKATWSKIMSGIFNWPTDGDERFEAIVGNNVLTKWQMHKRGYKQPEPLRSTLEVENEQLRTRIAELERDNRLFRDLIQGRA